MFATAGEDAHAGVPGVQYKRRSLRAGVASPASPLSVASDISAASGLSNLSNLSNLSQLSSLPDASTSGRQLEGPSETAGGRSLRSNSEAPSLRAEGPHTPPSRLCLPRPVAHTWRMADFRVGERVGRSRLSNVYHATHKASGMEVALKCYLGHKLDAFAMTQVRREIEIHGAVTHRSIATFHGSFEEGGNVCMIHEYARRGDVYNALSNAGGVFSERKTAAQIVHPVASAVAHLHARGFMHRDIKPENLLISDGDDGCLLTDFGFALDYRKSKCVTRLGTTDYMAPEIVRCDKARRDELRARGKNGYGPEVDCWAIGVLAYECLVGTAPFEGEGSTEETYARILRGDVPEMPPGVSAEARAFVAGCLTRDPARRLTAQQMLSHAWIQTHERSRDPSRSSAARRNRDQGAPPSGIPEGESPRPGPVPKKAEKAEEAVGERDAGVVYAGGAGGAGAWLGRHKSASAGFFPAAEAALAEHGADGDAGPSARRLSLEHSLGLWRSQSLTNVVGENLKRGLGRIRELVFSGQSEHSDRNYGGDADRDADR